MKIKITYQADEELQAVIKVLKPIFNGYKICLSNTKLKKDTTYTVKKIAYISASSVKHSNK